MSASDISRVLLAIVVVAGITTLVAHKNTAKDLAALGKAYSDSIKAAIGK